MFGFDTLFEDSVSIIKKWTPETEYSKEYGYREELKEVLRVKLNEVQNPLFAKRRISVKKEHGIGYCDIDINQQQIAVELKKDINKKDKIDRLVGQVNRYKLNYRDIIIVLVGKTDKDKLDDLKDQISGLTNENPYAPQQQRIKIIDKGSKIQEKSPPPRKSQSPSGFDFSSPSDIFTRPSDIFTHRKL